MNANKYLEAARVEELESQFRTQGYNVIVQDEPFNIIASRDNERIAIYVIAQSSLADNKDQVLQLRQRAERDGYTDFRLVVVSPPREKNIKLDNLDNILLDYIINNYHSEIQHLASAVNIQDVTDIDIDSAHIQNSQIEVNGTATLEVEMIYGGSRDNVSFDTNFPLQFNLVLYPDLSIKSDYGIHIDTSDYEDD